MRWNRQFGKKLENMLRWHIWFAWHPVRCQDGTVVWLEFVWRCWPWYLRCDSAPPLFAPMNDWSPPSPLKVAAPDITPSVLPQPETGRTPNCKETASS